MQLLVRVCRIQGSLRRLWHKAIALGRSNIWIMLPSRTFMESRATQIIWDEDNKRVVDIAVETFGGVHVSFINAGVVTWGLLGEVTEDRIDATFGPNFKGVVFGLKHQRSLNAHVLALIVAGGAKLPAISKTWDNGAVVVNTSTGATKVLSELPAVSIYSASKAAAEMMVKYGAVEGAALNVRVNGIAPGGVRTPLSLTMGEKALQEGWEAGHLIGKGVIMPEEVIPLVLFLLSDGAKAMTGSIHTIDQGSSLK